MFAEIIVNRPTHRLPPAGSAPLRDEPSHLATFTYRLPALLRELAMVGHLVQVPLQASTALGVIAALTDAPPEDLPQDAIRDVAEILDPLPIVTPTQIELARWIATAYLAPLNQAMRLVLPPGLEDRTMIVVSQTEPAATPGGLTTEEKTALRLLRERGGRQRLSTLLNLLPVDDPEAVIHSLAERGLVDARFALVPPQPAPPRIQYVRLLADDATLEAALPRLGRPSKQADLLLAIARRADAPQTVAELCALADCGPGPLNALAERGWVTLTRGRSLVVAVPGAGEADLRRARQQATALSVLLDNGGLMEQEELLERSGVSAATLAALDQRGLVQRITEEPLVLLTLPPGQVMDRVVELRGAEKHRAVLDLLRGTAGRVWVGGIYAQTGANLATLRTLAERGLISLHATEYERRSGSSPYPEAPPALTPDQASVWQEIERGTQNRENEGKPFVALIHGVTGSGKTEIYLRALESTLAAGQRAVVLVPEISLTAQTVQRFETRFPGRVAVLHSQLSLGQRYAVWDRGRRGEVDVIIGPRSALLAPIPRLGLIILDEAHDDSYKQTEPIPLPPYQARDVALVLGRLTGATVLLGSATPDLVTYHHATQGQYLLLELPRRILSGTIEHPGPAGRGTLRPEQGVEAPATYVPRAREQFLPPVHIVDLRQELRAGNRSIFSRALQEELRTTLAAGEQAILFLNRRGSATFVLCRDCGHVARCPNCDLPLTYHRLAHLAPSGAATPEQRDLACHHCNHREPQPVHCPNCGGRRIRFFGLGTEKVEEAVRELYPQARLLRWDRDTATAADHERYLQTFVDHRADVLIGTQMIAKGLDLPLVTLVGVISADTALHLPDYRAAERTFQVLTQVAGRAGRSQRGDSGQSSGRVIVQTYNPDHYAIQTASRHDYAGFYRQELAYRRQLGYPPFSRLVALHFSDRDAERCRAEAQRMGRWLDREIQRLNLAASLIGPAPCFYSRVQGRYRWQIVVRGPDPTPLLRDVALPRGWRVDVDPVSLL